jgi:aminoglycoside phosphotransferase (APT) family kinase protein
VSGQDESSGVSRPWEPQHVVSAELATTLIEAQFPALSPVVAEPLGVGWDNTVYRVGQRWVFRFPRRQVAVDLLQLERNVLGTIADALPLPVPRPTFDGQPSDAFPWPFAGYTFVPGQTACTARLDEDQRAACARPLARFMRALHDLPPPRGTWGDTIGRADMTRRIPHMVERLQHLHAHGLVDDLAVWERFIADHPPIEPTSKPVLVHGDLYARHILLGDDALPCGIIDWGDVHHGQPGVDLALLYGFIGPAGFDAFFKEYGDVDPATHRLALLRAAFHATALAFYGSETDDEDLVFEGQVALGHVLDAHA